MIDVTIINTLVNKYKTRDPFEIADYLNIMVFYEPLGNINGYYNTVSRQKQIHINSKIHRFKKKFTCAHELGHAIMHSHENTPFLKGSTFLSVNKLELEANTFAVHLLISDADLKEYNYMSTCQLASMYGIEEELIQLRIKSSYN